MVLSTNLKLRAHWVSTAQIGQFILYGVSVRYGQHFKGGCYPNLINTLITQLTAL